MGIGLHVWYWSTSIDLLLGWTIEEKDDTKSLSGITINLAQLYLFTLSCINASSKSLSVSIICCLVYHGNITWTYPIWIIIGWPQQVSLILIHILCKLYCLEIARPTIKTLLSVTTSMLKYTKLHKQWKNNLPNILINAMYYINNFKYNKKKKSTEYMNSNIANLELLKEKKGH